MCDMITITIMITIMSAILFYRVKKKNHCCDAMFLCVYIISSFLSCVVWFHFILYCFEWFNLCVCRKYRFVHSKVFGKKKKKRQQTKQNQKKRDIRFYVLAFWWTHGRWHTVLQSKHCQKHISLRHMHTHAGRTLGKNSLRLFFCPLFTLHKLRIYIEISV